MRDDAPRDTGGVQDREHADGGVIALGTWIDLTIAMPAPLTRATRNEVEIAGEADAVATALRDAGPGCAMRSTRAYAVGLAELIDAKHRRLREENPTGGAVRVRITREGADVADQDAGGKAPAPGGDEETAL